MTIIEAPPTGSSIDLPPPTPPTETAVASPDGWAIVWRGHTYRESDLTGQHMSLLALISGTDDWETLDIDPRHGYQRLMNVLVAFEAARVAEGHDSDSVVEVLARAVAEVAAASADEILGALRHA